MAEPWYERYFTAEFWAFARTEYNEARTAHEVAYLDHILAALAPGRRVLDVGCGIGRHAIPLARAGYQVTGVDVSVWALEQAQAGADAAGVTVTWRQLDLLTAWSWDLPAVDAAICIQAFGWGRDAEQLRLLRTLRRHLAASGILILDHSNLTAILRAYVPRVRLEAGGDTFDFLRSFDPMTGRSVGELRVRRADGRITRLHDDLRLYQPHEVRRLLRISGFDIERVDADFRRGTHLGPDTRYVQFVARPSPPAPPQLADADIADGLDLRSAPDEVEYVRPALDRVWKEVVGKGARLVCEWARRYTVDDPFGGHAAPRLARHFGCRLEPAMVAFGAGSTSILRDLGTLAASSCVIHSPLGHPELIARAWRLGAETFAVDPTGDAQGFAELLQAHRPVLAVMDRPGIEGELCDLATVERLASIAARTGTILVVDEVCATYAGPRASAVRLASSLGNLVVVRSMSKGYCCGGLRVGYAISSPDLAASVRATLAPLGASQLAFEVALGLLDQGDIFEPLRRRIAAVKPAVAGALRSLGLEVVAGDPRLPWVIVDASGPALALLQDRCIFAKRLSFPVSGAGPPDVLRISVPLSDERVRAFFGAVRWADTKDP